MFARFSVCYSPEKSSPAVPLYINVQLDPNENADPIRLRPSMVNLHGPNASG